MCSNEKCQKIYWQVSEAQAKPLHLKPLSGPSKLKGYSESYIPEGGLELEIHVQGNQYGNALENLTARVLKQPQQLHFA